MLSFYNLNQILEVNNIVDYKQEDSYENKIDQVRIAVNEKIKDNNIVFKDDEKRLITASVLIPWCDDCDAKRGEKQHSPEEIQDMMIGFMVNHRIVDKMHDYAQTEKQVGDVVENWQLRQEETHTNIFGVEKTFDKGTWMATTLINDDETWENANKGVYNSYSVTAISKELSDQLAAKGIMVPKERVLIKDLKDPVGYTISLVPAGCVYDNDFLSMKGLKEQVIKAGRAVSDATFNELKKAQEALAALIQKAENERNQTTKNREVEDMDEKELREIISDEIGKSNKSLKDDIDGIKGDIESLKEDKKEPDGGGTAIKCTECEHELQEADKFCPACGDQILQVGEKPAEKIEDNPVIKGILDQQKAISEKLGIPVESQKLEGQDDKTEPATKSDSDFYKDAGLKMNGRPLDEK